MGVLKDIKSIKIQGATNVALAGIDFYLEKPEEYSKVISVRPTEPLLHNSLAIIRKSRNPKQTAKKITSYIESSKNKIAKNGSTIIKDGMNIFTHCHSSSVIAILKEAKKQKKDFVVYNTETQPLLQGRKTAEELADAGINVIHLPDNAAEYGIRKSDIVLFGADAYLKKGVINKIGTSSICEVARIHRVPTYSCGISLKYTKKTKIEQRPPKEVWDERNKRIEIVNPAFDITKKKYVSGVISELGFLPYGKFIRQAKKNLKSFGK